MEVSGFFFVLLIFDFVFWVIGQRLGFLGIGQFIFVFYILVGQFLRNFTRNQVFFSLRILYGFSGRKRKFFRFVIGFLVFSMLFCFFFSFFVRFVRFSFFRFRGCFVGIFVFISYLFLFGWGVYLVLVIIFREVIFDFSLYRFYVFFFLALNFFF